MAVEMGQTSGLRDLKKDQADASPSQDRPLGTSRLRTTQEVNTLTARPQRLLTISLWSILQAESDGQHGIILKELSRESIPPEIVALLGSTGRGVCVYVIR